MVGSGQKVRKRTAHSADANRSAAKDSSVKNRQKSGRNMMMVTATVGLTAVAGILIAYISFFKTSIEVTFVHSAERVDRAVLDVLCSKDYEKEDFNDCKPKRCSRVVMDNLVSKEDAEHLLSVAQKGLALGGSSGGASILDLHSGALSKGNAFIDIYRLLKTEKIDLLTAEDFRIYTKVKNQIHEAVATEFEIPKERLYLTNPTFFSRMNTNPPQTVHDEYWHPHIDKETYGSFHYTSLLYLATYGEDFSGGRFIFKDADVNRTVEPRLGRVSFFTSGSENVHFVERLKDGVRYAITVSFTCDPAKAISDPQSK